MVVIGGCYKRPYIATGGPILLQEEDQGYFDDRNGVLKEEEDG